MRVPLLGKELYCLCHGHVVRNSGVGEQARSRRAGETMKMAKEPTNTLSLRYYAPPAGAESCWGSERSAQK
jgi:hypothetical protein